MKLILGLTAAVVLLASTPAFAQDGRQGGVPAAAGVQRGLQSMHNSGQNGYITLFSRGSSTRIVVDVRGMNSVGTQTVAIERGKLCSAFGPGIVAQSANLVGGMSRGTVAMSERRLMSGNYVVVVRDGTMPRARVVSCGMLFT
jgi:hypothetical protein